LFFSAKIVSALSYLHSLNIDLTPKNILLDKDGHLVIIDFEFSKIIPERSWTMCGLQKYLAPEIIECILTDVINWPRNKVAKDFIENLLERDRTKRLGSTEGWAEDVKNHRYTIWSEHNNHHHHPNIFGFFKTFNWEDVYHKRLKPPIVPKAKPEGDAINVEAAPEVQVWHLDVFYYNLKGASKMNLSIFDSIVT
jgi:serine/threonine protein kinase